MSVEPLTPEDLSEPHGYHHVVRASGTQTVYTSGQTGVDPSGAIVGDAGDYRAQAYQATLNLYSALRAAGASPEHVVKTTMYVVDPTDDHLQELYRGLGKASRELGIRATAATLVGVTLLAVPGALYEVDAVAVID